GFIIQDTPEQVGMPLTAADLWEQRHFGCHEPDPFHGVTDRRRLLHKAPHGAYRIGRHNNGVSCIEDPPLYLFWYGWCPLELKLRRNKSTKPMVAAADWGSHHVLSDEAIIEIWKNKYLPPCYDPLDGRWPTLNDTVERLKRFRSAGPKDEGGAPPCDHQPVLFAPSPCTARRDSPMNNRTPQTCSSAVQIIAPTYGIMERLSRKL